MTGSRPIRVVLLLAALLLLATFAPTALFVPPVIERGAFIYAKPVPLDGVAPQRRRLGALVFLQGWSLSSDNPGFGGISAMHVEGSQLVGLNDGGWLISFPLPVRGGRLRGTIESLPDGPGSADVKSDRDSEALTVSGDHAWIGFERQNAIWRYRLPGWRSDSHAAPEAMARWPKNSGSEGMVRLADGRFLVFSEATRRKDGTNEVLLFLGDPAAPETASISVGYKVPEGYHVTDAALLPDGRLLILNRRFTVWEGVSAKLIIADVPGNDPNAVIGGKEIADFRPPVTVDNMEALSVTREGKRTIIWIASDDNFNPLQRTLLLKFALAD